ncbi:hypothetical protein SDC9_193585 [bioreactor metagenome]|uniref:Uncharacterized protein n=1 Tax=bioreactor metagenome TaxID=1076179 RepID=A0A645I553_9ZZZZ
MQVIFSFIFGKNAHFVKFHGAGYSGTECYCVHSQFVADKIGFDNSINIVNAAIWAE